MATSKVRDSAFVLHSTPYRETSLVVDLLTREHGRVGVVAKGAKRPGSALRAALLQFQPISVVWSGQGAGGGPTATAVLGDVLVQPILASMQDKALDALSWCLLA